MIYENMVYKDGASWYIGWEDQIKDELRVY